MLLIVRIIVTTSSINVGTVYLFLSVDFCKKKNSMVCIRSVPAKC